MRQISVVVCGLELEDQETVVGGISFLKTVNTLQVTLQKHKGGDGPSKYAFAEVPGRLGLEVRSGLGLGLVCFVMRMFSSKIDLI